MDRIAGFLALFSLALSMTLAAPSAANAQQSGQPMLLPVDPVELVADTNAGRQEFSIEVADDNGERSRGLMFRRDLPEQRGMLFVFENTRRVAFWMKNTPLPLDLIFIGEDGTVRAVLPGEPFSEAPIAPAGPVRFVLEVNRGVAGKYGIEPGDRLHHPEIDAIAGSD